MNYDISAFLKKETKMEDKEHFDKANSAVEVLGIANFIENHKEHIYERLEHYESDRCAQTNAWLQDRVREEEFVNEGSECDMIFIADNLSLIRGVVYVGSSLDNFNKAVQWAKKIVPGADSVSVLSALTFIYIVERGWNEFKDDKEKQNFWQSIYNRVIRYYKQK
jgi:hypothetical protein